MAFKVFLHPKADSELKKLDRNSQKRIKKALNKLEKHPKKRGKHLRHSEYWSLRIGKQRAIYEIKGKNVVVLFIGHRKNVYSDLSKLF